LSGDFIEEGRRKTQEVLLVGAIKARVWAIKNVLIVWAVAITAEITFVAQQVYVLLPINTIKGYDLKLGNGI